YGEVARGRLSTGAPVHVRNRFSSIVDGQPFTLNLDWEPTQDVARHLGRTMSVRDLAYHMITTSSNFATNLLIDVVGVQTIQRAREELKLEGVVLRRGVQDEAAFQAGLNNEVTANGLLKLLRLIAEGRAWSPETCAQMLEILLDQRVKSGIPAGLPGDAHVAHKTGNISTVHHDAGIIYRGSRNPYFLVVLTQFPAEARPTRWVAEVGEALWGGRGRPGRPREGEAREPGPPRRGPPGPPAPRGGGGRAGVPPGRGAPGRVSAPRRWKRPAARAFSSRSRS